MSLSCPGLSCQCGLFRFQWVCLIFALHLVQCMYNVLDDIAVIQCRGLTRVRPDQAGRGFYFDDHFRNHDGRWFAQGASRVCLPFLGGFCGCQILPFELHCCMNVFRASARCKRILWSLFADLSTPLLCSFYGSTIVSSMECFPWFACALRAFYDFVMAAFYTPYISQV